MVHLMEHTKVQLLAHWMVKMGFQKAARMVDLSAFLMGHSKDKLWVVHWVKWVLRKADLTVGWMVLP